MVLIFGVVAIVLSLVQAALMLFRQAALLILAGVLPLAAAGSIAPMTRAWVRKVTAWMLTLICYKPAAAAVYATAFTMIGKGGSPQTALMGFVMLLLSVLTLPALMKFFTWTTGTIASSGGGGQLLGAATVGAIALGAMRTSGGGSAQDQAAYLNSRLGSPAHAAAAAGTPPGGPPSGPGGGPGPLARRAPSGAAPGTAPSAAPAPLSGPAQRQRRPASPVRSGQHHSLSGRRRQRPPRPRPAHGSPQMPARLAAGAMDPGDQP